MLPTLALYFHYLRLHHCTNSLPSLTDLLRPQELTAAQAPARNRGIEEQAIHTLQPVLLTIA